MWSCDTRCFGGYLKAHWVRFHSSGPDPATVKGNCRGFAGIALAWYCSSRVQRYCQHIATYRDWKKKTKKKTLLCRYCNDFLDGNKRKQDFCVCVFPTFVSDRKWGMLKTSVPLCHQKPSRQFTPTQSHHSDLSLEWSVNPITVLLFRTILW